MKYLILYEDPNDNQSFKQAFECHAENEQEAANFYLEEIKGNFDTEDEYLFLVGKPKADLNTYISFRLKVSFEPKYSLWMDYPSGRG